MDFPERTFIDDDVGHHAAVFLIVGGEVLDAGTDALGLDAVDHRRGQLAGQQGILGEVLEIAPAQGMPLDVHGRTEQDRDVCRSALGPQRRADRT